MCIGRVGLMSHIGPMLHECSKIAITGRSNRSVLINEMSQFQLLKLHIVYGTAKGVLFIEVSVA